MDYVLVSYRVDCPGAVFRTKNLGREGKTYRLDYIGGFWNEQGIHAISQVIFLEYTGEYYHWRYRVELKEGWLIPHGMKLMYIYNKSQKTYHRLVNHIEIAGEFKFV